MRRAVDGPVIGIAATAFAVICCAGLPAIGALVGGLTIAAVLGVAAGVLALTAALGAAVLVLRTRRRRSQHPPYQGGPGQ
jgi:hypothetical protein